MPDLRETLLSLIDYDAWAMERVLAAAEPLSAGALTAEAGASNRSVHQLLVHLNTTFAFWTAMLEQQPRPDWSDLDVPDVPAIRTWSTDVRAGFRAFVAGLSADDLDRDMDMRGATRKWWEILVQCLQHAIHHRGEIASMLTDRGHSPGDLDYIFYLRERDASV